MSTLSMVQDYGARDSLVMRVLLQLLALLAEQREWAPLLLVCSAQLGALAHFLCGALESLSTMWNLTAWGLQARAPSPSPKHTALPVPPTRPGLSLGSARARTSSL